MSIERINRFVVVIVDQFHEYLQTIARLVVTFIIMVNDFIFTIKRLDDQ